jgi:hypothetical protein
MSSTGSNLRLSRPEDWSVFLCPTSVLVFLFSHGLIVLGCQFWEQRLNQSIGDKGKEVGI